MKKPLLQLFALLLTITGAVAQPAANDSVSLGQGYAGDVYYSLKAGVIANVPGAWHIAFSVRPAMPPFDVMRSATISVNEGRGVSLFKSTQTTWSTFDTTGYKTWSNPHNSDSIWDLGAFNADKTNNPFDFGWGLYSQNSHNVEGSAIFLLRMTTGSGSNAVTSFKKVFIEKLAYDTQWVFTYSNLDGSDSMHVTIGKGPYQGKLFVYYDVKNHTVLDREPNTPWDLLFTRYGAFVTQFNQTIFSSVTGVLSHPAVQTAQVSGKPEDSISVRSATFGRKISTIGTDWKINPGPGQPNFLIVDSNVYFVRLPDSSQYRLAFRSFSGSSTGNISFFKQEEEKYVGLFEAKVYQTVALYPNPATNYVEINAGAGNHTIQIFDITGKVQLSTTAIGSAYIDLSNLRKGLYFVQVDGSKAARLVVE